MLKEYISHYKILERLGSGGMGIVYKAEDIKLHRTIALKFLPLELTSDETAKDRFIREAQAASSLQHNNICTIHEIDETKDGQLFIAMDYYEGETLKNKISRERLSLDEVINITTQTAEGLCNAHEKGIIHRDIKPANIFITKHGTVKILDFGLAKKIDQTQFTRRDVRFGTTEYMSPEQIKGEKVDLRTDIWSLGILFYEMLTGQHPFKADYEQAIVYLVLNQEPEEIKKYRPDVPEWILSIFEKLSAKERDDRYENLTVLLEQIKKFTGKDEIPSSEFELPLSKPSNSIAVLPFVNMSIDLEQEHFCDGLTEELINALSKISDLRVVARSSAFTFKGGGVDIRKAGRKLNVKTVLEGSVRKSGDKLRITAQLINVMDGYHLWSESFDRKLEDMFKVQEEISLAIVDALKVKLLEVEKEKLFKRYTDNIEVYNLVRQGYYTFNQLDLNMVDQSIEYFNKAIQKDPSFAPAYAGLAGCYFIFAYFGVKKNCEIKPIMKRLIQKALEIDENVPEGYHVLGLYKSCMEGKHFEAVSAYRRSLEINPNDPMALQHFSINQVASGHFDYARKLAERALLIDPLSDYIKLCVAFPDFYTAKYEKVLERINKFSEDTPPFLWGLWYLWRTYSLVGKRAQAVEILKKIFIQRGADIVTQQMDKAGIENAIGAAAYSLAEIYKHRYVSPYDISILFSHAGKQDEALYWVEKSIEDEDPRLHFINVDPEWQNVREGSRFKQYLQKTGFGT